MLFKLNPCLNMSGLIKLLSEEMLLAIPTASVTLPAAPSQLVFPPPAQLLKKEVGFNAPANWVSRLPGFGLPLALDRASFNCACEVVAARPRINNKRRDFF